MKLAENRSARSHAHGRRQLRTGANQRSSVLPRGWIVWVRLSGRLTDRRITSRITTPMLTKVTQARAQQFGNLQVHQSSVINSCLVNSV